MRRKDFIWLTDYSPLLREVRAGTKGWQDAAYVTFLSRAQELSHTLHRDGTTRTHSGLGSHES